MLSFPSWPRQKKRSPEEGRDNRECQASVFVRIDHNGLKAQGAQAQIAIDEIMALVPASNDDSRAQTWGRGRAVADWLDRFAEPKASGNAPARAGLSQDVATSDRLQEAQGNDGSPQQDDWQSVLALCGYGAKDFASSGSSLPLTAAEIDHFLRNHRETENYVSRDFLISRSDLPSPLGELYGLYLHRARVDAEAALFVAQATGSTRVAQTMADLLAIGGFSNALEYLGHAGLTYSVPAALDTASVIDAANDEASHRMAIDAAHPGHLLKLTPDDIAGLAGELADRHALEPADFLDKANLLAEARQDVARMPVSQRFATALIERDLPLRLDWVARIGRAYARLLNAWVADLPEIKGL